MSSQSVPLCDLSGQLAALKPQLEAALARVLASGQVILGPEVAAFEEEVARYTGASHAIGCGSGTEALSLALHGMEIGPGDEVILPTFTFFATAGSVARTGATPVFVDIDPVSFNLDPRAVEAAITPRTRAIMAVHLFGQCADMDALRRIAEKHGLPIIEDAAQSMGATHGGKQAGSLGAVGCFSFYPTKNLGGYGDSGMVVTGDPAWASRMAILRTHGMQPRYYHKYLGWNARIDALQAALLRVKLPHLDRWIGQRQEAAKRYDALIAGHGLDGFLTRPSRHPGRTHTFNQYVVKVADGRRDALAAHLKASGIGCEIYYPVACHQQECLAHLGYRTGDFPVSEAACKSVIALPMFPEITAEQQERVVQAVASLGTAARRAA
ncbi:MAG: DegT/DnrJ/EryC1/StrS family aminotransferase [Gemmataceae bacterium]|nr:DegT/DnrJ/EryC1/StrS family aminotransferase [Gemmataceae bacterium]